MQAAEPEPTESRWTTWLLGGFIGLLSAAAAVALGELGAAVSVLLGAGSPSAPVVALNVIPGGSVGAAKVSGEIPPCTGRMALYGAFSVAFGKVRVVATGPSKSQVSLPLPSNEGTEPPKSTTWE